MGTKVIGWRSYTVVATESSVFDIPEEPQVRLSDPQRHICYLRLKIGGHGHSNWRWCFDSRVGYSRAGTETMTQGQFWGIVQNGSMLPKHRWANGLPQQGSDRNEHFAKKGHWHEVHQQLPTPHYKFTDGNILAIQGLWIPGRDGVLLPNNSHVGGERLVVKGENYFRTKKSSNFFRNDITSFDYGSSIRTLVRSPSSQRSAIFKVTSWPEKKVSKW